MSKKFLTSIFVLFLSVLAANAQNANVANLSVQDRDTTPAKSVVRGRVVYEDSGIPVRRGMIGLLDAGNIRRIVENNYVSNTELSVSNFVLTDDDGEFEIKNVRAGEYYPFVQVPNALNPQSFGKFYGNYNSNSIIKLEDHFQKIIVDGFSEIQAFVNVKRGAAISGRILYFDDSPVIGAQVEVVRKGGKDEDEEVVSVKEVITDDRGFYRFNELPPGEYFIKVTEPSDHRGNGNEVSYSGAFLRSSELNTFYPNAEKIQMAKSVTADWGQELTGFDVIIPNRRLFKLSGTVIAKDTQKPLKNVKLRFQKVEDEERLKYYDGGGYGTNVVYSDEKGNWFFKDLPQGKYRIEISPPDEENSEKPKASQYAGIVKEIKIEDKNLSDALIELPLEASVSGTVTVEGKKELPEYVYVYLLEKKSKIFLQASYYDYRSYDQPQPKKTKWDFRIGGISEGTFDIIGNANRDEFYVKSIKIGGAELTNQSLEIKEGQEIKDLQIILSSDVGTLKGKIFESQNKPAKLTWLLLIPTDSIKQKGNSLYFNKKTNLNGEFEMKAAPGEYFVTLSSFRDAVLSEEEWLQKVTKDAPKVTIKAGETTEISLTLPEK